MSSKTPLHLGLHCGTSTNCEVVLLCCVIMVMPGESQKCDLLNINSCMDVHEGQLRTMMILPSRPAMHPVSSSVMLVAAAAKHALRLWLAYCQTQWNMAGKWQKR